MEAATDNRAMERIASTGTALSGAQGVANAFGLAREAASLGESVTSTTTQSFSKDAVEPRSEAKRTARAVSDDELLALAMRTIMQFESDAKVAGRAMEALLGASLTRGETEDVALTFWRGASLTFDGDTRAVRYRNDASGVDIDVRAQGEHCAVEVRFPERAEPWHTTIASSQVSARDARRIRAAAKRLAGDPDYQAWRGLPGDDGKLPTTPLPAQILAADAYRELFADGVLSVNIAYGYLDDEPSSRPTDKVQAEELRTELKRKHGFVATKSDPWVLERQFTYEGKTVTCRVNIAYSAAPQELGEAGQRAQSKKARGVFVDGLRRADVTMYDGHSRAGRGPDFAPYNWWNSPADVEVGHVTPYLLIGDLTLRLPVPFTGGNDLEKRIFDKDRYQILVFDSCKSEPYYRKQVMEDAGEHSGKGPATLDVITTNNDSEVAESIPTKLTIILDLMAGKTAPEIDYDLNKKATTEYNTTGLFIQTGQETRFDEYERPRVGVVAHGLWGRFSSLFG